MKPSRKNISHLFVAALLFAGMFSCAGQKEGVKDVRPFTPSSTHAPIVYTIQPGDQLDIKFFYNPELNEGVIVRPDGMISLQLIDEIQAAGLKPAELDQKLTDLYSRELRKPVLTVIVRSFTRQRVYIGGEVTTPGLIVLPAGMTTLQAIFQSGGFRETADPAETLVIRKGENEKPFPIRINLDAVMEADGNANDLSLQPDDIVYVPKSAIADANKFIDEYIGGLLMFRGWSFGITQNLGLSSSNFK